MAWGGKFLGLVASLILATPASADWKVSLGLGSDVIQFVGAVDADTSVIFTCANESLFVVTNDGRDDAPAANAAYRLTMTIDGGPRREGPVKPQRLAPGVMGYLFDGIYWDILNDLAAAKSDVDIRLIDTATGTETRWTTTAAGASDEGMSYIGLCLAQQAASFNERHGIVEPQKVQWSYSAFPDPNGGTARVLTAEGEDGFGSLSLNCDGANRLYIVYGLKPGEELPYTSDTTDIELSVGVDMHVYTGPARLLQRDDGIVIFATPSSTAALVDQLLTGPLSITVIVSDAGKRSNHAGKIPVDETVIASVRQFADACPAALS